ncbi:chemotaxis-specific protein-glutamate methyltransferase CheB [Qipengyuania sp. YIM B01966]|uniref:chemotaxis-specific protein-glutamate methyltransferase CheB n=1 Tax=Qipengyuania sp. YIM B01966 TaxID=2778646 RepID=UPI001F37D400|nr:chemotaxis-specific protein-glutamate methyltransferase CheB [Qipengyuania sp. YIM B01966]
MPDASPSPAQPPPFRPALTAGGPLQVMVVDDSLTTRTAIARLIDSAEDMVVAATAASAERALAELPCRPLDVIVLDLEMPGMGGMEALPRLLAARAGVQVLVVSALTEIGAEATLRALALGAADTMPKPRSGGFNARWRESLLKRVRVLGRAARGTDETVGESCAGRASTAVRPRPANGQDRKAPRIIAFGASTGGIHALCQVMADLPRAVDLPILVTQHLPPSFMEVFARQLTAAAGRPASVAQTGTVLEQGRIYVAPGTGHLLVGEVGDRLVAAIDPAPAPSGCLPSVDPMLQSLADALGGAAIAVILSGMGRDGALGAAVLAAKGGTLIAQDRASSAVWGMPRAVAEAGLADAVLPPALIAAELGVRTAAAPRVSATWP